MSVITAAVIVGGSAIAAASISSSAAKDAAKTAAEGQTEALTAVSGSVEQARGEVLPLFEGARESAQQGIGAGIEFLTGAIPQQIEPFRAGNVAAQQQLTRGLPQIQNAILGNPIDLSGFQARKIPFQGFNLPTTPATIRPPATQPVVGGVEVPENLIGLDRSGFTGGGSNTFSGLLRKFA